MYGKNTEVCFGQFDNTVVGKNCRDLYVEWA